MRKISDIKLNFLIFVNPIRTGRAKLTLMTFSEFWSMQSFMIWMILESIMKKYQVQFFPDINHFSRPLDQHF